MGWVKDDLRRVWDASAVEEERKKRHCLCRGGGRGKGEGGERGLCAQHSEITPKIEE